MVANVSVLECAGALIFDPRGRLFVQRRSPDRSLFPNCWDIVGGHVEPGESPEQTLRREVIEETGWHVRTIHGVLDPIAWTGDDGKARLEYDFLVSVDGDLQNPALEVGKHTEWRWITAAETPLLNQDRRYGDSLILELVLLGFAKAHELGLA
ncbi:MAG TPA: NUDIX hydrolase [Micromonosporaceae bacterium]|nr:NUDIX hydrolase [Micromonosporaceae bacterium]